MPPFHGTELRLCRSNSALGDAFWAGRASCGSRAELPGLCGIRRRDNTWPRFSLNGRLALCGRRSDLPRKAKMNCFASREAQKWGGEEPSPSPAPAQRHPASLPHLAGGGSALWECCSPEGFNGEPFWVRIASAARAQVVKDEDALVREGVLRCCLKHATPQIKAQQL